MWWILLAKRGRLLLSRLLLNFFSIIGDRKMVAQPRIIGRALQTLLVFSALLNFALMYCLVSVYAKDFSGRILTKTDQQAFFYVLGLELASIDVKEDLVRRIDLKNENDEYTAENSSGAQVLRTIELRLEKSIWESGKNIGEAFIQGYNDGMEEEAPKSGGQV